MYKIAIDRFKDYDLVKKFLILFSLLVIVSYPSGPFLPDLFLTVTSIIFLYISFKKKLKKYFFNPISIFFLLFFIFIILNSIFALHPLISLKSSAFYPRFYIFALSIWYLLDNDDFFKKIILNTAIVVLVFVNLDTLIQYFVGADIFGFDSYNHRLSGPFGEELIVGSFISKLLPFIVSLYFLINKKITLSIGLLIATSFCVTFLSGERTSFFYIFTFLLIYLFFCHPILNKKILISFIIASFLFILTTLMLDKSRYQRMVIYPICAMNLDVFSLLKCTSNSFADYKVYEGKDGERYNRPIYFSEAHEGHIKAAFKMFLDAPIFGKGNKMYRYHCGDEKFKNEFSCTTHPHNLLLQVLAELGLVGFIFFMIVIYKIYKTFYLLIRKKIALEAHERLAFIAVNLFLIQIFFVFLPSGQFFNNHLSILYYLPLGIYLNLDYKFKNAG